MLAHHELCIDDMIDVYSDSVGDEEYLNIDVLVDKIVLHSDVYEDNNSYGEMSICLDSCAGESIFKSKNLFRNFRQSDVPVIVRGVNSDSNPMIVTEEGETEFGTVYYSEYCVANVLSLGNAVDEFHIVRYLDKFDRFIVQVNKKGPIYTFHRDTNTNTYICDLANDVTDSNTVTGRHIVTLVSSVSDNMKKYSTREVKQAALARRYQINLGPCSSTDLIKLITQGKLDNNRIVAQDVIRAYDIWGPALANLKGKTTSHKSELQEEISVLNAQLKVDQIMFVDLMFVNSIPYLVSVFKPLEYVSVSKLAKKDILSIYNTVINHVNSIRKHGLNITMLRVDGESAISTDWFNSKINAEGIILDTTGAGEAVSVVERKIRQIKERFRGISNTLPFKLTETLETWLVKYVVSRIVLVPTKNSIEFVSPREKLWGRRINVDKELKHGFGDYVQVHSSVVNNSMYERTSGAIALMPSGNLEGSWYFYLLHNGEIVKRNKATTMPITDDIIAYLNSKAVGRKGKIHNIDKPLFEMGNQHIPIDDYDDDIEFNAAGNDQPDVFHDIPIENLLDDNFGDEYPYEHSQDNHQHNDDINDNHVLDNNDINDNHIDNEIIRSIVEPYDVVAQDNILNQVHHDDIADPNELNIRGDNRALLDDTFGIDSDDDKIVI